MIIQDAIKEALACNGRISRVEFEEMGIVIIPVNFNLPFDIVTMDTNGQETNRWKNWNPSPSDLIADDWKVIRAET